MLFFPLVYYIATSYHCLFFPSRFSPSCFSLSLALSVSCSAWAPALQELLGKAFYEEICLTSYKRRCNTTTGSIRCNCIENCSIEAEGMSEYIGMVEKKKRMREKDVETRGSSSWNKRRERGGGGEGVGALCEGKKDGMVGFRCGSNLSECKKCSR